MHMLVHLFDRAPGREVRLRILEAFPVGLFYLLRPTPCSFLYLRGSKQIRILVLYIGILIVLIIAGPLPG